MTVEQAKEMFGPAMRILHAINKQGSTYWTPEQQAEALASIPGEIARLKIILATDL